METKQTAQSKKKSPTEIRKERRIASYQECIDQNKDTIVKMEEARKKIAGADVVGMPVSHKTFGNGTVTDQTRSTITVKFVFGDKRFVMPDAFVDGFLATDDPELIEQFNQYREMGEQIRQVREDMSTAARAIQTLEKK